MSKASSKRQEYSERKHCPDFYFYPYWLCFPGILLTKEVCSPLIMSIYSILSEQRKSFPAQSNSFFLDLSRRSECCLLLWKGISENNLRAIVHHWRVVIGKAQIFWIHFSKVPLFPCKVGRQHFSQNNYDCSNSTLPTVIILRVASDTNTCSCEIFNLSKPPEPSEAHGNPFSLSLVGFRV